MSAPRRLGDALPEGGHEALDPLPVFGESEASKVESSNQAMHPDWGCAGEFHLDDGDRMARGGVDRVIDGAPASAADVELANTKA